jgi:hypothetical protein
MSYVAFNNENEKYTIMIMMNNYYKDNCDIYDYEKFYPPSPKGSFLVLVYISAL